jgi:peptidoglycan/LPS O-acetylase OafA/YrhL
LAVLVGHAYQVLIAHWYPTPYPYFGLLAQFAVMVFFVLSGFLIGKSITRHTVSNAFSFRDYCLDRAIRIVPPLVFTMLLTVMLAQLAPYCFPSGTHAFLTPHTNAARDAFTVTSKEIASTLIFLNGFVGPTPTANASLWSLPFEVWLYVIAGLAVYARGVLARIVIVLAISALLSARSWTFCLYALVWGAGFGTCLLHNHSFDFRKHRWSLWLVAILLTLLATGMAIGYVFHCARDGARAPITFRFVVGYSVLSGLAFAVIFAQVLGTKISVGSFVRDSSAYSYTLYVVNFPLLLFTFGTLQPLTETSAAASLGIAIAASVMVIGIAKLVARFVENTKAWRSVLARLAQQAS